jgi:hypothetical protein
MASSSSAVFSSFATSTLSSFGSAAAKDDTHLRVEDAVRMLIREGAASERLFPRLRDACEEYALREIRLAKKRDVKRSFVRLLGAAPARPVRSLRDAACESLAARTVAVPTALSGRCPRTPVQERDDNRAEWLRATAFARLVAQLLVQLYLVFVTTLRFGFAWRRSLPTIIIEGLCCDGALLLLWLTQLVGDERPARHARSWLRHAGGALVALLALAPLEVAGALTPGADVFDPLWHTNRLIHALLVVGSLGQVVDRAVIALRWHADVTRVVTSFARLVLVAHLVGCIAIRWRPNEPTWLAPVNSTATATPRVAVHVYFAKVDWALKQLAGTDNSRIIFPDQFRFWLSVCIVLIGLALSALIISAVSTMVDRASADSVLSARIDAILDASEHMMLPSELTSAIAEDTIERGIAATHMMAPSAVFGALPEPLRHDVMRFCGAQVVKAVPLFAPCLAEPALLAAIAASLTPVVLPPLQVLFHRGDPGSAMYFVVDGTLAILAAHASAASSGADEVFRVGPGGVLGELSIIARSPRTATARARDCFVHLVSLSRAALEEQEAHFPRIFAELRCAAKRRYVEFIARDLL